MPQRSAVLNLPEEIKAELDKWLVHKGFAGYVELSEWLEDKGYAISKSALHRYGSKFEERLASLKMATEQAKAVVAASPDDEGAVNDALMRLVQERLFSVLVEFDISTVKEVNLGTLARAIADLARASVKQKEWQAEVKTKASDAAEKVEKVARKGGLSEEAVKTIREEILGVGA